MASRIKRVQVENEYDESGTDEFVDTSDETTEDSRPRFRTRSGSVSSGWGAPVQELQKTVQAPYLDLKNGKVVIKIHDEMPTVNFRQHYVNSQNRYYTCMQERDERGRVTVDCPLCVAGHYATQQFRMNITDMSEPTEVKTWTFGRMVSGILQEFLADDKTSPLNKESLYFQVWRTKPANGSWTYTILPLKARDLQEDYGVEPLTSMELEDAISNLYGGETVWINTEKQLQEAADKLTEKDTKRN